MICYRHHNVVRLSVCNAVHSGSQGRYRGLKVMDMLRRLINYRIIIKSCTVVFLAGNFLFTSSDTVAVGCINRLAIKHAKKRTDANSAS